MRSNLVRLLGTSLALLLATACGSSSGSSGGGGGGGGGPPLPTVTVTGVSGPLFADLATVFVVEGSGYGTPGDIVLVQFTTVLGQGTPFSNGTSQTAVVEAIVQSDTSCVGLSPPALSPGSFQVFVDVVVGNAEGLSDDAIGLFVRAPAIPNVQYFPLIAPDASTEAILVGGAGADVLIGGVAADQLFGNAGNDYLDGMGDNDEYTGGADLDAFAVDFLPGTTDEIITDLNPPEDIIITFGDPNDVSFSVLEPLDVIADNGLDVQIQLDGSGSITLQGIGDGTILDITELLFAGVAIVVSLP